MYCNILKYFFVWTNFCERKNLLRSCTWRRFTASDNFMLCDTMLRAWSMPVMNVASPSPSPLERNTVGVSNACIKTFLLISGRGLPSSICTRITMLNRAWLTPDTRRLSIIWVRPIRRQSSTVLFVQKIKTAFIYLYFTYTSKLVSVLYPAY